MQITTIIAHKDYNHLLPEALDSCLQQTVENRICVVDDGSKTDPLPILEQKLGQYKKYNDVYYFGKHIYFRKEKNQGLSAARNTAISLTYDSDAFMILDADDVMMKNKVEILSKYLSNNIAAVYGNYYIHYVDSNVIQKEYKHSYDFHMLPKNCMIHCGSLINKKALEAVRISENEWYRNDITLFEDYNLWLRMSKFFLFIHVPEFLTLVREHSLNMTKNISQEKYETNMRKVFEI